MKLFKKDRKPRIAYLDNFDNKNYDKQKLG